MFTIILWLKEQNINLRSKKKLTGYREKNKWKIFWHKKRNTEKNTFRKEEVFMRKKYPFLFISVQCEMNLVFCISLWNTLTKNLFIKKCTHKFFEKSCVVYIYTRSQRAFLMVQKKNFHKNIIRNFLCHNICTIFK